MAEEEKSAEGLVNLDRAIVKEGVRRGSSTWTAPSSRCVAIGGGVDVIGGGAEGLVNLDRAVVKVRRRAAAWS
eukprot:280540-Prorocentrum_minimum.AAC.2